MLSSSTFRSTQYSHTALQMAQPMTLDEVERKKEQATRFLNNIGEPGRADEFESMSAEEYADHRGTEIVGRESAPSDKPI